MNFILQQTIAQVFTAGTSLEDLSREMDKLVKKKVYSVADLSIEDVGNAADKVHSLLVTYSA